MKTIMFKLLLLGTAMPLFGQIDESTIPQPTEPRAEKMPAIDSRQKDCCSCPGNILKDGGFENLTVSGPINNIASTSAPWTVGSSTPQWNSAAGLCNKGYVSMWGNKVVGESVKQSVGIAAGKYQGKFVARFMSPTAKSTHVNLEILINSTSVFTSEPISNGSWACYQIPPFTAPAGSQITLRPTNQYNTNHGDFVSWIQVDSICLQAVSACDCAALAKEFKIGGPADFCKPLKCDKNLEFTVPKLDEKCYKYEWQISPKVEFSGQGTSRIGINCNAVKAGKYEMKLSITCDGKTVSAGHVLTVCDKPNPQFSMSSNGTSVTLSSSVAGNHQWAVYTDSNNNCTLDESEIPTMLPLASGNSATFNNLSPGKQYLVIHRVSTQCGKRCLSANSMCFKFMPAPAAKGAQAAGPGHVTLVRISEKMIPGDGEEEIKAAISPVRPPRDYYSPFAEERQAK